MKQAVQDLKDLYGRETIDSDQGPMGAPSDSDSEGTDILTQQSAFMKAGQADNPLLKDG